MFLALCELKQSKLRCGLIGLIIILLSLFTDSGGTIAFAVRELETSVLISGSAWSKKK